jgi:hypothetical protein
MSEAAITVPIPGTMDAPEADEAWTILDTLTEPERRFVNAAIRGKDLTECAEAGGWRTEEAVARVLGRPRVKAAIERLAPLLAANDPKRAARLLLPYWVDKLYKTASQGSDAQSTGAIKELIALAGVNSTRVEHLHASLADVVAAIEARQKSAKALPPHQVTTVQAREITPEDTDTESVATSDAAIWGDDHSSEGALSPVERSTAATPVPKKHGGKRGGRKPRAKPEAGVGDPSDPRAANTSIPARRK